MQMFNSVWALTFLFEIIKQKNWFWFLEESDILFISQCKYFLFQSRECAVIFEEIPDYFKLLLQSDLKNYWWSPHIYLLTSICFWIFLSWSICLRCRSGGVWGQTEGLTNRTHHALERSQSSPPASSSWASEHGESWRTGIVSSHYRQLWLIASLY